MHPFVLLDAFSGILFALILLIPSPTVARSSAAMSHAHRKAGIKHRSFLQGRIPLSLSEASGNKEDTSAESPGGSSAAPCPWKLAAAYSGSTFFDGWTFFTAPDPTNGNVDYVDRDTAQKAGLIEINSAGHAVMRVETTPTVQGRNRRSVRITTDLTFTEGLVILDAVHMPTGCGTWPAFWTFGPNWPYDGEIDIVEGINNAMYDQATIHTGPGCNATLPGPMTGTLLGGTNCNALASTSSSSSSSGSDCSVRSHSIASYCSGFNAVGGGVYAMYWDNHAGIKVWFFERGSVPLDIEAGVPLPQNWPTPLAYWANSKSCNMSHLFRNHSAVFDTTLCGSWAGNSWNSSASGQSMSCQRQTGCATCAEFVQANGAHFRDAFWEVSSVKIYQEY